MGPDLGESQPDLGVLAEAAEEADVLAVVVTDVAVQLLLLMECQAALFKLAKVGSVAIASCTDFVLLHIVVYFLVDYDKMVFELLQSRQCNVAVPATTVMILIPVLVIKCASNEASIAYETYERLRDSMSLFQVPLHILESKTLRMTRIAIKEHVFSMMSDDVVFEVLTLVVRVSLIGTLFARAHVGHEIRFR